MQCTIKDDCMENVVIIHTNYIIFTIPTTITIKQHVLKQLAWVNHVELRDQDDFNFRGTLYLYLFFYLEVILVFIFVTFNTRCLYR